jgi:hypothetical protein
MDHKHFDPYRTSLSVASLELSDFIDVICILDLSKILNNVCRFGNYLQLESFNDKTSVRSNGF